MTATQHSLDLVSLAVRAAEATGGEDFVALDISEPTPFTDAMLLATGNSERNVVAIADSIEETLREVGVAARRREGRGTGRWVLLDFNDLVVHIFHRDDRLYYGLERLWLDCPTISVADTVASARD